MRATTRALEDEAQGLVLRDTPASMRHLHTIASAKHFHDPGPQPRHCRGASPPASATCLEQRPQSLDVLRAAASDQRRINCRDNSERIPHGWHPARHREADLACCLTLVWQAALPEKRGRKKATDVEARALQKPTR